MNILWVAAFGAVGSSLRYLVGLGTGRWLGLRFPYGTLTVNLLGCFAIGVLMVLLESRGTDPRMRLALITGLLGGFTTYSAFALDTLSLVERRSISAAALYVSLSMIGGLLACAAGVWLARRVG